MKTITLANSKGGVGKSTLLTNIIGQSILMNYNINFFDMDKQKSLEDWAKKKKIVEKKISEKTFEKKNFKKNLTCDFLFIDTPASIKRKYINDVVKITDFLIIPTTGSDIDLSATKRFYKRIAKENNKMKILFILNKIRYSISEKKIISYVEKKINNKIFLSLPLTKSFEDQFSKGSSIKFSRYSRKNFVENELIRLIKYFNNVY